MFSEQPPFVPAVPAMPHRVSIPQPLQYDDVSLSRQSPVIQKSQSDTSHLQSLHSFVTAQARRQDARAYLAAARYHRTLGNDHEVKRYAILARQYARDARWYEGQASRAAVRPVYPSLELVGGYIVGDA